MVNIRIPVGKEEFYIRTDRRNWMIGKIRKDKKNQDYFDPESFFGSLEACMRYMLELKLRGSTATTISGLKSNVTKAKKELAAIYETNNFLK